MAPPFGRASQNSGIFKKFNYLHIEVAREIVFCSLNFSNGKEWYHFCTRYINTRQKFWYMKRSNASPSSIIILLPWNYEISPSFYSIRMFQRCHLFRLKLTSLNRYIYYLSHLFRFLWLILVLTEQNWSVQGLRNCNPNINCSFRFWTNWNSCCLSVVIII